MVAAVFNPGPFNPGPFNPGPRNLISDVPGVHVGNAHDDRVQTGVTVVSFATAMPAAVDSRGGAPGLRETEVLRPENLVGAVDAIVLAGGSVFGLGAADAVTAQLSARGQGLRFKPESPAIPIVCGAVLHDLGNGGDKSWGQEPPYGALGRRALENASADFGLGRAGAGFGARAGLHPGGLGSASLDLGDGLRVGALAAVNSVGTPYMPDGKSFWAWPFEIGAEFGGHKPHALPQISDPFPDEGRLDSAGFLRLGANTTLCVVATNAQLSTAHCLRVAIMAQDGLARAIRPAHTPQDGDCVFAVSTGTHPCETPVALARIGSAAADCLARAIARGAYLASV
jgi:L-aminopeptidase/D-esterase-like protein